MTEQNPFTFKTKEDYIKASESFNKILDAQDEWEDMIGNKTVPNETNISHWSQLLKDYNDALADGLKDEFK